MYRSITLVLLQVGMFALSVRASAAGPGEYCGRFGFWRQACDPGLSCDVRWSAGRARLGVCAAASCGGLHGLTCPDSHYCDFPADALCGITDQTGVCQPRPRFCTKQYAPVCGCNGEVYSNVCNAHVAGISLGSRRGCDECHEDTDCPSGTCDVGVSCLGVDCPAPPPSRCNVCGDGSELRCKRAAMPCPDGQVREIVDGCYGSCVERAGCEPASCDYEGKTYAIGESFPDADGCNTCSCSEAGSVVCTLERCEPVPACRVAGCSSELCVGPDDNGISSCVFRPENACYSDAICEAQADGLCGWRQSETLSKCIEAARAAGMTRE
jgi:hypothetical protein